MSAEDAERFSRGEDPLPPVKYYTTIHVKGLPNFPYSAIRERIKACGGESHWVSHMMRLRPLDVVEMLVKTAQLDELRACLRRACSTVEFVPVQSFEEWPQDALHALRAAIPVRPDSEYVCERVLTRRRDAATRTLESIATRAKRVRATLKTGASEKPITSASTLAAPATSQPAPTDGFEVTKRRSPRLAAAAAAAASAAAAPVLPAPTAAEQREAEATADMRMTIDLFAAPAAADVDSSRTETNQPDC